MGVVCSDCSNHQEDLNTQIVISKDNFTPVTTKPSLFQEIQTLSDHSISQTSLNHPFYLKAPNTFFIGSLQETLQNSFGVLYKPGQTLFYGNFLNRLIHGKGTLKLIRHNIIFHGEFNQGKPQGKGIIQGNAKTFQFNGIWNGSSKPLSGVLKLYSNKTIQQIQFINFQHGDAQIYYRNGSSFKGFIDKKTLLPHGSGKMTYVSGNSYEGEWANGKFQGIGTYLWKTGEKYNGDYSQGLRNGDGDFYYTSGKYFKGTWKNGKKQGFGKILAQDGKVIEKGIYHDDIFDHIETENFHKMSMENVPYEKLKLELVDKSGKQHVTIEKMELVH